MIELQDVVKRFAGGTVVDGISFSVAPGEVFVLIGPSGCGKSTTLRMVNRLIEPTSGHIRFGGEDVAALRPEDLRRRMGYAIQSIGLFPHWTIEQNIATVPRLLRWPAARIRDRVTELLRLLQLDPGQYRGKYPHQLSGGQQQRVGVARALAADPELLLMDEPFGALDPITRRALQDEIVRIHQETKKTILFVTHDMDEALRLASRIAVMQAGRVVQLAPPLDLVTRPANAFVREFVGQEDLGLRLLSVATVRQRLRPMAGAEGLPVAANLTLRQALSAMIERGTDRLGVVDEAGAPLGAIHLADLLQR
jgi:osmoprotectant transport system ATP-binding protein